MCLKRLSNLGLLLSRSLKSPSVIMVQDKCLHTSNSLSRAKDSTPTTFLKYNDVVYPPQKSGEQPRPAFVCHQMCNIKYSPYKMWYVASFIRGMTVDEAIRQLKFCAKKGAKYVRQTIEEARELAVKDHNVEFPSNLWVAESFAGKGPVIKGIRRHARQRPGRVEYVYCHYFVRLEEGIPPKHYYHYSAPKEPKQQIEEWLDQMRKRKIINSL